MWIASYAANFGDKMPNEEKYQLASCLTKKNVYEMCKASMDSQGLLPVSRSPFYKLWRRHFSDVTIQKVRSFEISYTHYRSSLHDLYNYVDLHGNCC